MQHKKFWTMFALAACIGVTRLAAAEDEGQHHALTGKEVGSVHFANSCSKDVQLDFQRAVALLHSFQYEQAREAFSQISKQDAQCAMAQWGVAMSHYHCLWHNGDTNAGREALHKAQEIAANNKATTTRKRGYIEALSEIYKEDGKDESAHGQAYEHKMAALQAAYLDNSEAAIFHALALAVTAPKTDKTFSNQRKCGEILEPIFDKQPNHPGVAHYIIHCYDNPVLAEKGLRAARKYAAIAPASAHANHMPSHLFTRVGSWEESIHSNLSAAELATGRHFSQRRSSRPTPACRGLPGVRIFAARLRERCEVSIGRDEFLASTARLQSHTDGRLCNCSYPCPLNARIRQVGGCRRSPSGHRQRPVGAGDHLDGGDHWDCALE